MTYRWLRRRIGKFVRRVMPPARAVAVLEATDGPDRDLSWPAAGPVAERSDSPAGGEAPEPGRILPASSSPVVHDAAAPSDRAAASDFEPVEDAVSPEAVLDEIEAAADRVALAGLRATSAAMRRSEIHGSAAEASRRLADLARQAGEAVVRFEDHVAALRPERPGIELPRVPAVRAGADLSRDRMLRRMTRSVAATANGFEIEAAEAAAPGAGAAQATGP